MITLLALAIAFLTLLTPSPAGTQSGVRNRDSRGETAIWADQLDPFDQLLGDWIATITLPEGDTELAVLTISRPEDEPASISMGHGDERFAGPLTAHFEGSDVVFAGAAISQVTELGTATISGRLSSAHGFDGPTGSAYLPSLQRLITWTARAARSPSSS